jgi:hypothetical protein
MNGPCQGQWEEGDTTYVDSRQHDDRWHNAKVSNFDSDICWLPDQFRHASFHFLTSNFPNTNSQLSEIEEITHVINTMLDAPNGHFYTHTFRGLIRSFWKFLSYAQCFYNTSWDKNVGVSSSTKQEDWNLQQNSVDFPEIHEGLFVAFPHLSILTCSFHLLSH